VKWQDLNALVQHDDEGPGRRLVHEDKTWRILLLCFKAGQKVTPCVMERDVVFLTLDGTGTLREGGQSAQLRPGVMVVVPRGVERVIEARDDLVVLGVQAK